MLTKEEKRTIKKKCFVYYCTNIDIGGAELVDFVMEKAEDIMEKKLDKLREKNKHLKMVLDNC